MRYTVYNSLLKQVDLLLFASFTYSPSLVPQPIVVVTANSTGTLYAGTSLTLSCTVILDSSVDNSESVVTEWSGLQSIPEYRYSATDAMRESGSMYSGSLTISPLADHDDGIYACNVTVTGGVNVQSATTSDDYHIFSIRKSFIMRLKSSRKIW